MYLHEVQGAIDAGKPVRRGAWSKSDRLVRLTGAETDLTKEEKEQAGLNENATITSADLNVFCSGKKQAVLGYELTHEDKTSQDWEVIE